MLQLTFLGTSAGVPTKQRNVTALAVECINPYPVTSTQHSPQQHNHQNSHQNNHQNSRSNNKKSRPWVLIDCGEGTQQQLLHTKLSLQQLSAICITHVHGDHCYGLPGLLASAAMSGRTEPLTIIAPKAIATLLNAFTLTTELYLPFVIHFMAIEEIVAEQAGSVSLQKVSLNIGGQQLDIDITALSHRVPSHAFGITQTLNHGVLNTAKLKADGIAAGMLWGKLQRGENVAITDVITGDKRRLLSADYVENRHECTRVVIAGDNDSPQLLTKALSNTDLLVHEATYTADMLDKIKTRLQAQNPDFDPMHSSAQQVGKFAQDIGLKNLILTHFSARYQNFDNPKSNTENMSAIRLDAERVYQGNLWLAADFAQYLVNGATDNLNNRVEYLGSALDGKTSK